jgi:hypothetical protein
LIVAARAYDCRVIGDRELVKRSTYIGIWIHNIADFRLPIEELAIGNRKLAISITVFLLSPA